jgi:hypothetical protein
VSAVRDTPGETRTCPHCKATILASATVCPACRHHLRAGTRITAGSPRLTIHPFTVEGRVRGAAGENAWEYAVVLSIRNDGGEEIGRQVVGVGAMRGNEGRTFTLDVEVYVPV